eukprot:GHVN01023324.1.p1 GENE.GHVN01023324.1~~GHVN01023324.1.p1  ORF type:complete len:201 (-),score=8.66 GHVN01023324.1:16-618(-)
MLLTEEALLNTALAAAVAEATGKKYSILPMYRMKRRETAITTRSVTSFDELCDDRLLTRQEAQLMVRYDAPVLYNDNLSYGRNNKFALLVDLATNESCRQILHCLDGFGGGYSRPTLEPTVETREVNACGMCYRLPYWTENATNQEETELISNVETRRPYRTVGGVVFQFIFDSALKHSKLFHRRLETFYAKWNEASHKN